MKHSESPGEKVDLVIARHGEDLGWILNIPEHVRVIVHNKGEEIDDAALLEWIDVLVRRENVGRETESYLRHLSSGMSRDADRVVFTQGDPFPHSPDFMGLLGKTRRWGDVQAMSVRWLERFNVPPRMMVEGDRRDWVDGLRVRREVFSLRTWGPVGFPDGGTVDISRQYRAHHGLRAGTNIAGHFLSLAGWDDLADEAAAADLGVFSYAAIFAVKGVRLGRMRPEVLERLMELAVSHTVHGYVCERLWLHFFGAEFITINRGC